MTPLDERGPRTTPARPGWTRRAFLRAAGAAGAAGAALRAGLAAKPPEKPTKEPSMIWGNLLHLSFNMWADRKVTEWGSRSGEELEHVSYSPKLRFDEKLWRELTRRMVDGGLNMVVIDVGDGIEYECRPEVSVQGAWPHAKLRDELARLREIGLEPIPKLNFSTAHDTWLGPYSRCVSTPEYYKACSEIIAEVAALFDKPRLLHLGYDEETARHQRYYDYVVIRQHELWWHDFLFFAKEARKNEVRPWIWSDYCWHHPEFFQRMPKDVLQSDWYYGNEFDPVETMALKACVDLNAHGYDQVPTGSNYLRADNLPKLAAFCRKYVDAKHLKGFLQTAWRPTLPSCRAGHIEAIDAMAETIKAWQ